MSEYRLPPKGLVSADFKRMLDEYPTKKRRDTLPLGIDEEGNIFYENINNLEDILVGGTTTTGKTNFLNNLICSILMKHTPEETKLVLIDTKGIEFSIYENIPHLLTPIIKDSNTATNILTSLIKGVTNRKEIYHEHNLNSLEEYNNYVRKELKKDSSAKINYLPNIFIIIDDYTLMNNEENKKLLEELLHLNDRTGIHVICGTSLPSKNIITEEMRKCFLTRVGFNFVEDEYIRFILGSKESKHIEGENNYIVKTSDGKYHDLSNMLLSNMDIMTITDYIKYTNTK